MHAHLYAQKHNSMYECCLDAMDYDDNFELFSSFKKNSKVDMESGSIRSTSIDRDLSQEIANLVLKGLGQRNRTTVNTVLRGNVCAKTF